MKFQIQCLAHSGHSIIGTIIIIITLSPFYRHTWGAGVPVVQTSAVCSVQCERPTPFLFSQHSLPSLHLTFLTLQPRSPLEPQHSFP